MFAHASYHRHPDTFHLSRQAAFQIIIIMRFHYSPFLPKGTGEPFDPATTALIIQNSPNRLYHSTRDLLLYEDSDEGRLKYQPDLITGDLDSMLSETRQFYEDKGVQIVKHYDQDYNDLDKSIQAIPDGYKTCFVYGAFGGRFDQEMASIQALFAHANGPIRDLSLWDDQNAAILLVPGEHTVQCPNYGESDAASSSSTSRRVMGEGPTCGLIPIGEPCQFVTTTGLKWNLDNQPLAFGGIVSSSNHNMEEKVTIKCSRPLLFTAEVDVGLVGSEDLGR